MAVCSIWVQVLCFGGWSKIFIPPRPPNRGNTVPYLPKIYGKPCTWWLELNLELSFDFFNIFEVLNLVFACTCNEKDFKLIKFWNASDNSVLYSIKSTRCGSMIYIHACSFLPF